MEGGKAVEAKVEGRKAVEDAGVAWRWQSATVVSESTLGAGYSNEATHVVIPSLSSEQVYKLLSLKNAPKLEYDALSSKGVWMLDGGASCHMNGYLDLIDDV